MGALKRSARAVSGRGQQVFYEGDEYEVSGVEYCELEDKLEELDGYRLSESEKYAKHDWIVYTFLNRLGHDPPMPTVPEPDMPVINGVRDGGNWADELSNRRRPRDNVAPDMSGFGTGFGEPRQRRQGRKSKWEERAKMENFGYPLMTYQQYESLSRQKASSQGAAMYITRVLFIVFLFFVAICALWGFKVIDYNESQDKVTPPVPVGARWTKPEPGVETRPAPRPQVKETKPAPTPRSVQPKRVAEAGITKQPVEEIVTRGYSDLQTPVVRPITPAHKRPRVDSLRELRNSKLRSEDIY
jgi:hypothetical protein